MCVGGRRKEERTRTHVCMVLADGEGEVAEVLGDGLGCVGKLASRLCARPPTAPVTQSERPDERARVFPLVHNAMAYQWYLAASEAMVRMRGSFAFAGAPPCLAQD